jgi:xylulose-5-phosphate/fructose-6-phosphate phosphoketolase
MPAEILDRPNPPPGNSQLPETVLDLEVNLDITSSLSNEKRDAIQKFRRMANYIAAAMIFLKDNILLTRDLRTEDIKPRLLGHWGTCPGLTLVYAHLNHLAEKENEKMIFVVGPGLFTSSLFSTTMSDIASRPWSTRDTRLALD